MNNGPEHTHITEGRDDGRGDGPFGDLGVDPAEDPQLEAALRQVLGHQDTPPGFTDRLVARVLAGDYPHAVAPLVAPAAKGKVLAWPSSGIWVRGAIAAALLLGVFEGESAYKRFREQQRRIAEATAQFQTTERVTLRALAQAKEQLQRAGVPLTLD